MSANIKFLTVNVSGLRNKTKRTNIFHWLKRQNCDIIFMQETHCGSEAECKVWKSEWEGQSFWTIKSTNSLGTAILANTKDNIDITHSETDTEGRWNKIVVKIENQSYQIINIYAPNKGGERKHFFKNTCSKITEGNLPIIMGGDFNCTLGKLDRRPTVARGEEGRKELHALIKERDMEDIFRRRNPEIPGLTFFKKNSNSASRLDMWIISKTLDPIVQEIKTHTVPSTDHYAVELNLNPNEQDRGPGRWQMNTNILNTTLFKRTFKSFWKTWKGRKLEYKNINEWWEESKLKIKDIAIWCGKKQNDEESHDLKAMERKLKALQENNPNENIEINSLKESIQQIHQNRSEGDRIRAKAKWIEEGEKSSKFFHGLEKSRGREKSWSSVKTSSGEIKTNIAEILDEQRKFFEKLYTNEETDEGAMNKLLSNIDIRLTEDEKNQCEQDVRIEELNDILKTLKNESSPGMDGIPYEFYKNFWDDIKEDFCEMVKSVLKTECCMSQYLGIIILLYKNGLRNVIENWRPITLLNCDFKLIEKIFANRLKKVIKLLIKEDQYAYIDGRYIGDSVRLMADVIFESELRRENGAIILIDQSKAYDRVEWTWLKKVLKQFNFGDRFISWIFMLYAQAKSTVMTNGFMSETIPVKRGLRQGSPLSSLLYILQAEPFAQSVRSSDKIMGIKLAEKEVKISSYADDTQIFVKNEQSIKEVHHLLDLYSKSSGAKINHKKTEGILLGNMKGENNIKWTKEQVKSLGIPQGLNENLEDYWEKIKQKIQRKLDMWKRRHLTMQGKVQVIKTIGIGSVTYAAGLKCIPEKKLKEINTILWNFVWNDKTEQVKRTICMENKENGGIGMPSINYVIQTRQIMMVKRIISDGKEKWKELPRKYLKTLDTEYNEEYFLLKAAIPKDMIDSINIPMFYKECIMSWQNIMKNLEGPVSKTDVLNERLWFNSKLHVNRKPLDNKIWAKRGIQYVKDILSKNGTVKLKTIQNKVQKGDILLYINKINKAIPKEWKQILKGQTENEKNDRNKLSKIENMKSKQMYATLLKMENSVTTKSRWETEWEEHYGPMDWKEVYKVLNNRLIDRKAIDIQWLSLQNGLYTESKLQRMNLSDGFCKYCTVEKETCEHLFYDCELIGKVWEQLGMMTIETWSINCNKEMTVIFGQTDEGLDCNVSKVIQYVVMSCKFILWKRSKLLKHEERWINDTETIKWINNYLTTRTKTLLKTKLTMQSRVELKKLLIAIKNYK